MHSRGPACARSVHVKRPSWNRSSIKPRDVMPEGARTLPARYYTDPALLKAELDGLFGDDVVLCRAIGGGRRARAVLRPRAERPQHRRHAQRRAARSARSTTSAAIAARASATEATGQFAGSIQCPYHAWTYDLDGKLIGAPHMNEVPHFRKADYPLLTVHAAEWDGHVFLNLSEQSRAARRAARPAGRRSSATGTWRTCALGHRIVYDVKANWKLIIQNYNECLHCPNLHPALNKLSHYLSGENEPLQSTYMGGRMDLQPGVDTLVDGRHAARARSCRGCRPRTRAASTTTASSRT